jgi:hypothetical protein
MEYLRADRRAAGRAQDARRRARGPRRPLGRAAVRDVSARAEVPYGERRSAFGKERYSALGIAREDWEARQRAAIANWNCFGAPAAPWSQVRQTVAEVLSPPDGLILFCGMSIGYEDPTVRYARTGRARFEETVTFIGG